MKSARVSLMVNSVRYESEVDVRMTLGDFLRRELKLTGTHLGCEHGVCGACTILVEGRAVRSCLMLAVQANGKIVETIEGLAKADGTLSDLQEAFIAHNGLQCGFCTPGMLMTIEEMFREEISVDEHTIRDRISGNICRCTGYQGIVDAVLSVTAARKAAVQ